MAEENKFKEVDSIQLYNDYIGYIKLYDASHGTFLQVFDYIEEGGL